MSIQKWTFTALFVSTAFISFNSFSVKKNIRVAETGKGLFTTYCAACHMLPDPASLIKSIWATARIARYGQPDGDHLSKLRSVKGTI